MTNFQQKRSSSRLHWLTPERALFFVPVLTSFAVAMVLLALAAVPLWRFVRARQVLVEDLSIKAFELPQLEIDLLRQQSLKSQLEDQEDRLFKMLAGTKDLNTFLTGLNLLASRHHVSVTSTEPGEVETWSPPLDPKDDASVLVDPLQEGLEKRSALISCKAFRNIQGFIQDLERLEVFVISSDLTMAAIRLSGKEELIQTKLELQLSAYGRVAELSASDAVVNDVVLP